MAAAGAGGASARLSSAKDFEAYLANYKLLGIEPGADETAINSNYRKRAREAHPDKNPDNPRAEELFNAIKNAHEALLDTGLRAEFESRMAARMASEARAKEMDAGRRKLREELEAKERAAAQSRGGGSGAAAVSAASTSSAGINEVNQLNRIRQQNREKQAAMAELMQSEQQKLSELLALCGIAVPGGPAALAGLRASAALRVVWDAELNELAAGLPDSSATSLREGAPSGNAVLSPGQVASMFSPFGKVAKVFTIQATSAVLCFETAGAAAAALASPPAGFRVLPLRPVQQQSGVGSAAAAAGESGMASGLKRRRPEEGGLDSGARVETVATAEPDLNKLRGSGGGGGAAAFSTAAEGLSYSPAEALQAKEEAVFSKLRALFQPQQGGVQAAVQPQQQQQQQGPPADRDVFFKEGGMQVEP